VSKQKRRRRANPIFKQGSTVQVEFTTSEITTFAADVAMRSAIKDCTPEEKILIAAMVPSVLKCIRKIQNKPLLDGRDAPHEADSSTEAKP
jgi:hypothetical protein